MRIEKLINVLFVLLLIAGTIAAGPLDKKFEEGNKYYQDGDYITAVSVYENILSQGYESSELYYNLGNSYFKVGKIGYAILNYEKSLKLAPGDEDAEYNLELAKARTVDKIKEVPRLFILEWSDEFLSALSVHGWQIVVVALYVVFIFFIGLFLLGKSSSQQKAGFILGTVSFVVLIAFSIILFASYNRETTSDYGVVVAETVPVKLSPDVKSNDAFVIHEGLKFSIEDDLQEWTKIRLPDGKVGWLQNKTFEEI